MPTISARIFVVSTFMAFVPMTVVAQTTPAAVKSTAFDVISIRKNTIGSGSCGPQQMQPTPNGFRMTNCPLVLALISAYVPKDGSGMGFALNDRLVGAPGWLMSDRYDVDARIADSDRADWLMPTGQKEMLRTMLQSLLSDRCKLAVHREIRDKSTYALVVGRNGPKLQAAESSDAEAIRAKHPNVVSIPGGGGMFSPGKTRGSIELYGVSMETLALVLSQPAGRPVVNKTGLTGRYDVELEIMQSASVDSGSETGPLIFSAVQDRLGLKLEAQKNDVEILVIDHIERPSEN